MTRTQNPFRYLRWFVRDVFVWPFRLFLLAIVVISLLVWRFAGHVFGTGRVQFGNAGSDVVTSVSQGIQVGVWTSCLTVAILMVLAGIVGTDLERGYYRTWFSKPMSPLWYYLQRFALGAVVILVCPLVLGAGLALAVHGNSGITSALMVQVALAYLLVGSTTLTVSIFTSRGWLLVFLLSILQGVLGHLAQSNLFLPGWLVELHKLLPPFQLLQPGAPAPHGAELWHIAGYGAGLLILGAVLLRTRPLGNGAST